MQCLKPVPWLRLVVLLSALMLLAAGCQDGTAPPAGEAAGPGIEEAPRGLPPVLQGDFAISDLDVAVKDVTLTADYAVIDMELHNNTDRDIRVFLGACGPSQGQIHTANASVDVFYAGSNGDDMAVVPAGTSRSGLVMLRSRQGETFVPEEVERLELHPGYMVTPENEVQLLHINF